MHWARLEASALGGLIAACPAWQRREEKRMPRCKPRRRMIEDIDICSPVWYCCAVDLMQGRQAIGWRKRRRSTCHCRRSAMSSRLWSTASQNTFRIATQSWRGCCRTRLAATPRRWWWRVCRQPTTTTTRRWARCATPTAPRTSRTNRRSTKIQRTPCYASTRTKSAGWKQCFVETFQSWLKVIYSSLRVSSLLLAHQICIGC